MTEHEFEVLLTKHSSWIERQVGKICGMSRAADAVQEAAIELSHNIAGIQAPGHALLLRRATQRAKDIRRRDFHTDHKNINEASLQPEVLVGGWRELDAIARTRNGASAWESKKAPGGRKPKEPKAKLTGFISAADAKYEEHWLRQAHESALYALRSIAHSGEMGATYCIFGRVEMPR